MTKLHWRPIAELPKHVTRALVFDPAAYWPKYRGAEILFDERVNVASISSLDGLWYVPSYEGAFDVYPTHFVEIGDLPDGHPLVLTTSETTP